MIGKGVLVDPRALAMAPAPSGANARLFVADAGSHSIKVFDAFDLSAEFHCHSSSDSEWILEDSSCLECPVGLALTSQGDLVVATSLEMATVGKRTGSLVLLDSSGKFQRQIVSDLRLDLPYTLECDSSDRVTLLHRCIELPVRHPPFDEL